MRKNLQLTDLIDTKKSLCFLTLKVIKNDGNATILGWEISFAEDNKIVYTVNCDDKPDEKTIIQRLLCYVSIAKKYQIPVVTFRSDVIPIVRTTLLSHNIRVNLSDLKIVSLQKILQEHFYIGTETSLLTAALFASNMNFKLDDVSGTELLCDLFFRTKSLLPTGTLEV
jgi:hypothetical protein